MRLGPIATSFVLTAALLITACSKAELKPAEVNPTDMPKGPGLLSGESGNLLDAWNKRGKGEAGGNLGINVYLWRASLESISFMPITQADSNGGVITTDWYSAPSNPDERVRANVLIMSKALRSDGVKVSLFKQKRDKAGKWNDEQVSPATTRALEDTILTKARALKVQTLSEK